MVKSAVSYYDFYIDSAFERYDEKSGDGARSITQEVVPTLAGIMNMVVQAHYVKEFGMRLGVPEKAVYEEIDRFQKKKKLSVLRDTVKKMEKGVSSRRDRLEEYYLSFVLQFYGLLKDDLSDVSLQLFSLPSVVKVLKKVVEWKEKKFDVGVFGKMLPEELHGLLDSAFLRDLSVFESDSGKMKKEVEKVLKEIKDANLRHRLRDVSERIKDSEESGGAGLDKLQKEFSELSGMLSELG